MALRANGLGWAAREVAGRARSLVRLELELAALEVKRKLVRLALGLGLGLGAALFAVFAIGFLLAGAAAGIALALPVWAALVIVGGGLVVAAALLGVLALAFFRRGTPPIPEAAIEEAKRTTEALKANGR
jgi:uncharacterized SAM-binding protein YcdF (DUF218 family)